MLDIYVDADACPVKEEVIRVGMRHNLRVYLVSNILLNRVVNDRVFKIQVGTEPDAADDWIAEHAGNGDIVITIDILLAERCLKNGASALGTTGRIFNDENIGAAKAMREFRAHLRETGEGSSYNAAFSQQDRSRFLQVLEQMIQAIKRRQ
jgi:uncharacterized protein YaiI (UPF0178 family)